VGAGTPSLGIESPDHAATAAVRDANAEFSGQASAYILAQRLVREARKAGLKRSVEVFVPKQAGTDWADIWLATLAKEKRAA
ncbi:MAG: hypothetical protein K2Y02_12805, partial [Burkholderiaceae bacterium]|nr:hypothetical protein [Burkholderiaceae bacterium]